MTSPASSPSWVARLERWLEPFLDRPGRAEQRHWAPLYVRGLLLPGERKSVEPLAQRVCPGDAQQLYHFLSTSPWETRPCSRCSSRRPTVSSVEPRRR
ncbi:MAG TPA: transposase [Longimicrobiaceae bacterium]|nr:transposase [Longimicrobiaceae bacterium]